MADPNDILRKLESDHFAEVISASPKKFREEIFRRAGVKNRGGGAFALKSTGKNNARTKKLRATMLGGFELEGELGAELIRNYLYTRRPLLAEALDFLGVDHDEGLTDEDLDFLTELKPEKGQQLRDLLCRNHEDADVDLYVAFMDIPVTSAS